jgi:ATP-dependent Clp protease ATP-binding subunit ClpC
VVGTEHLLAGLLAEGTNLALVMLNSMEIEPDVLRSALAAAGVTFPTPETPDRAGPGAGAGPGRAGQDRSALRFSGPAANALELAVTEAVGLGHNYIGCEHLLLGLASETEGTGGAILRDLGAEPRAVRRAMIAALAGYTAIAASKQARAQPPEVLTMLREAVRRELQPLAERLDRLEERIGPEGEPEP